MCNYPNEKKLFNAMRIYDWKSECLHNLIFICTLSMNVHHWIFSKTCTYFHKNVTYNIWVIKFSSLSHWGYWLKTFISKHLTMHDKYYKINAMDHGRPCWKCLHKLVLLFKWLCFLLNHSSNIISSVASMIT
jgi:hypothetical protein